VSVTAKAEALNTTITEAIDALAAETDAVKQDSTFRAWLANMSHFYNYSFKNQMLISEQCPHATRVAGYQRWKEMGRNVVKGQKAIYILAPMMTRKATEGTEGAVPAEPIQAGGRVMGFRAATVFDRLSRDLRPAWPATVLRRMARMSCVRLDASSHIIAQFAGPLQGGLDTDEFQLAGGYLAGGLVVSFCCV